MSQNVVPGLLTEQRIACDDARYRFIVNLHLVPLSRTQYRLVAALWRQRCRYEAAREQARQSGAAQERLGLTVQELQAVAHLAHADLVKKRLSEASARLPRDELVIVSLHGLGYGLFRPWEVPEPGPCLC